MDTRLLDLPEQGIRKSDFPAEFKEWEPEVFSQRHKLAVLMQAAGLKNWEIAEELGFSESRVSVILNDPRARAVLEQYSREVVDSLTDVRLRLKYYANEALTEVVEEMRHSDDPRVRQRAAFGILDRAGYSKIEKRFVATAQVDPDAARLMADALHESRDGDQGAEYVVPDEVEAVEGEEDA